MISRLRLLDSFTIRGRMQPTMARMAPSILQRGHFLSDIISTARWIDWGGRQRWVEDNYWCPGFGLAAAHEGQQTFPAWESQWQRLHRSSWSREALPGVRGDFEWLHRSQGKSTSWIVPLITGTNTSCSRWVQCAITLFSGGPIQIKMMQAWVFLILKKKLDKPRNVYTVQKI